MVLLLCVVLLVEVWQEIRSISVCAQLRCVILPLAL